jgi:hypothetical protein
LKKKFEEIFAAQGAPPVSSLTLGANLPPVSLTSGNLPLVSLTTAENFTPAANLTLEANLTLAANLPSVSLTLVANLQRWTQMFFEIHELQIRKLFGSIRFAFENSQISEICEFANFISFHIKVSCMFVWLNFLMNKNWNKKFF